MMPGGRLLRPLLVVLAGLSLSAGSAPARAEDMYANPRGGAVFTLPPQTRDCWLDFGWLNDNNGKWTWVRRQMHAIGDGKRRKYYFDGGGAYGFNGNSIEKCRPGAWNGRLREFRIRNAWSGEAVKADELVFTDCYPRIVGEIVAKQRSRISGVVSNEVHVETGLFNPGTERVRGIAAHISGVPSGVAVVNDSEAVHVGDLPGLSSRLHRVRLISRRACEFKLDVSFTADGTAPTAVSVPVAIRPKGANAARRHDYVPEPRPLPNGRYEIGAFYFCDWVRADQWMKIWRRDPDRKPLLGWYDNRRPEVLDWQIKWAVENGISYFVVDWYGGKNWHAVDYFEQAFAKARYRRYMKWALMWCNHMKAGSCAEEAWIDVVSRWISDCFSMPEYLRVNGRPCVMVFDPDNLDRDNGGAGGCRRMLDMARNMARDAGYEGIWFVGLANEYDTERALAVLARRREQGFDETTAYHYLGTGEGAAKNPIRAYDDVVSSSAAYWSALTDAGGVSVLPNISTGWDDRPWNDTAMFAGRTVESFRRLCAEMRRFGERAGITRFCLAPLNEWGEGSYLEPNEEYRFGMYEALRETFFDRPAEGWPENIAPDDVGLGACEVRGVTDVVPPQGGIYWR